MVGNISFSVNQTLENGSVASLGKEDFSSNSFFLV